LVFPNPARDGFFTIDFPAVTFSAHLRVFNTLGVEVFSKELGSGQKRQVLIDTQGWARGVYVAVFESGPGTLRSKILIH
jgi:hypothetical protein